MKRATLLAFLLVVLGCTSAVSGAETADQRKKPTVIPALVDRIVAIKNAEGIGHLPAIGDTAHFKKDKALHELISKTYKASDWSSYTEACLDLALLERNLPREGLNAVHGYTNQKRFDEAEYLLNEISKDDSQSSASFYSLEKARLYEAEGRYSDAETILRNLSVGGITDRAAQKAYEDFLRRQGRTGDADQVIAVMNDRHCPVCGSEMDVIPIGYGLVGETKADERIDERVHPGGCVQGAGGPKFWCKKDKVSF